MQDQAQETYVSPFSQRYAGREMQALFSPAHRARLFRQLWLYLAQAEAALGLPITQEQLAELAARQNEVDFDEIARQEAALRHDVMAHLKAYALLCPKAAPIIHLGATSCYVTDNADVLIYREALLLLRRRLLGTARALAEKAWEHQALPILGFTHFQPAQPTTLGKRLCLYLQDLLMDLGQLNHVLSVLRPLGSKGATGTQASFLALFEGDREKVRALDRLVAQKMGFDQPVAVSGQTYSRKTDSLILDVLSGLAQSAAKFAGDLRLMAHLKEVEEPFESKQVGSSAMPYKRNPMRSERITGLARYLINNASNAAHTAATQWLERSLDDSANRRLSMAEGFLAADGILTLYENIVRGLVVYPKMMDRHLKQELPFMASENILMKAVLHGGDRQELHERIRGHAQEAGRRMKEYGEGNQLLDLIALDPAFGLSREELDGLLRPEAYTGLAEEQVAAYLQGEAGEALAAHAHIPGLSSEITV